MAIAPAPRRGEIWLVQFNPAVGAEIRKLRPALVLNVSAVGRLPLRLVAPITDWNPQFESLSWFVFLTADPVNGLAKDSGVDSFQVKSVSLRRFVRKIGDVSPAVVDAAASAVALCVGAP
jgi:mRNA interferase MazF